MLFALVLSIMTGGGQIKHALRMAKLARKSLSCPLVYGGPHVNVLSDQTIEHPLVDGVLVGQGQYSMPRFVEALQGRCPFEEVPGLLYKKGGRILKSRDENPPRAQKLVSYPWDLVNVETYIRNDPTISEQTLNFVSSQGCKYKCQFCYELTYQSKYSMMEAKILLDEVEELVGKYEIGGIKFYDADWFVNLRRAKAFSEGLIDRKIQIRWAASINPNDILLARKKNIDLLSLIASSGCCRLLMGVESGSNRVLRDVVNKEVSREQILDVAKEIAANGILGSYTFIVGFPGETEEEQMETYALIEELWKFEPRPETRVHIFAPYPGNSSLQ